MGQNDSDAEAMGKAIGGGVVLVGMAASAAYVWIHGPITSNTDIGIKSPMGTSYSIRTEDYLVLGGKDLEPNVMPGEQVIVIDAPPGWKPPTSQSVPVIDTNAKRVTSAKFISAQTGAAIGKRDDNATGWVATPAELANYAEGVVIAACIDGRWDHSDPFTYLNVGSRKHPRYELALYTGSIADSLRRPNSPTQFLDAPSGLSCTD